jgi:hypothetical protein
MTIAERMAAAVAKKLPKHKPYVRRYESGDTGYIEIAMRPEGISASSRELTTAYSDEFFLSATKENINEKATRIFKDFKLLLTGVS